MPVDALSATASQAAGGLRQEDFLKLMLQQLLQQDPLKPMDNTAFVAQMAQFSALAQSQTLNESMTQLITVQSHSQSIGLIGKYIKFSDNNRQSRTGSVQAIRFDKGIPYLTVLAGSETLNGISMGQITDISNTAPAN
jgi:flagellar basal-body rod modification protein FlgD